jgi:hypothetical protein
VKEAYSTNPELARQAITAGDTLGKRVRGGVADEGVLVNLISSLQACGLGGVVPLLSSLFLDSRVSCILRWRAGGEGGAGSEEEAAGGAGCGGDGWGSVSKWGAQCALAALKVLTNVALIDLRLLQRILGSVTVQAEFSHIALQVWPAPPPLLPVLLDSLHAAHDCPLRNACGCATTSTLQVEAQTFARPVFCDCPCVRCVHACVQAACLGLAWPTSTLDIEERTARDGRQVLRTCGGASTRHQSWHSSRTTWGGVESMPPACSSAVPCPRALSCRPCSCLPSRTCRLVPLCLCWPPVDGAGVTCQVRQGCGWRTLALPSTPPCIPPAPEAGGVASCSLTHALVQY